MASVIVIAAGRPSGTTPTASATTAIRASGQVQPQQRCRDLLDAAQQRADPADLGLKAGGHHDAGALARRHHGSRIGHAPSVSEGGVLLDGGLGLGGSHRFTREGCLVDQERAGLEQPEIGGDAVSGFDEDNVAGHDLAGGDARAAPVAQHVGARRDHAADGVERVLGLALLDEADNGIDEDHGDDDGRIDEVSEAPGRHRARQEEVDQRVVELGEEAEQRPAGGRGRKLVAAVACKALRRFAGGQSGRGAGEAGENFGRVAGVVG